MLDWSGKTSVILASGPSLTDAQVAQALASSAHVVAINATYTRALTADVMYAGDLLTWKHYHNAAKRDFEGQLWTQDPTAAERYKLHRIKGVNLPGLGHKHIHLNGNSGFQAINLAYLFGSRRILLLGFDMRLGPGGQKHWHPDHPSPLMQAQTFPEWMHNSKRLAVDLEAEGCEVVNCTPRSALTCWRTSTIEKELP